MQESKIILTPYKQPIDRLKRHMAEYQLQLKRAIAAINILETASPDSDSANYHSQQIN
ncbi:hypothetical protein [Pseudanabaena yagii]|uniref:Uncharacterized protein n=1 Tax=Pseudanabaena yagii GIHE-NHR1 TaxID=2722753 RepID=A0ABX1LSN5_9CYAN|nr:hypothetical protein [Pseudanabaena yagii]NMF59168.1 hypothetical protein [Pseudanabaena yagii GIHE-NHR1]